VESLIRAYYLLDALKKLSDYPDGNGPWSIEEGQTDEFIKAGNTVISQAEQAARLLQTNLQGGRTGTRHRPPAA
jgi:hypothetical protein